MSTEQAKITMALDLGDADERIDLASSMRMHFEACQRFCDLGETVLKLAADGKWGELVEHTANALNNADAAEDGDEKLYERAKAQARHAESRPMTVVFGEHEETKPK